MEAALQPAASNRVFEIVASPSLPPKAPSEIFADVKTSPKAAEKAVAALPVGSSGAMEVGQFAWVPLHEESGAQFLNAMQAGDAGELSEGAEFWEAYYGRNDGHDVRFL